MELSWVVTVRRASPADAIYDKKLLWRANYYVDERRGATDVLSDWNDLHPWVYQNDWNAAAEEGRTHVNGGQNDGIMPWTRFSGGDVGQLSPNQARAEGEPYWSVAYGWGGHVSPQEFNAAMTTQRDRLSAIYDATGEAVTNAQEPWASSLAPNSDWKLYGGISESSRTQTTDTVNGTEYVIWQYGPIDMIPGLSTYLAFQRSDTADNAELNPGQTAAETLPVGWTWNYEPDHADLTAGLDCSGFVQQAASYVSGREYQVSLGEKQSTGQIFDRSWQIAAATNDPDADFIGLERLVPGDIIVEAGNHVMIVTNVEYPADGSAPQPSNVRVIHSRAGVPTIPSMRWQVAPSEYWTVFASFDEFDARRLR